MHTYIQTDSLADRHARTLAYIDTTHTYHTETDTYRQTSKHTHTHTFIHADIYHRIHT